MEYFEVKQPEGEGVCSDNSCPCNEDVIPRGTGYVFIDQELVKFRRDCLDRETLREKLSSIRREGRILNIK